MALEASLSTGISSIGLWKNEKPIKNPFYADVPVHSHVNLISIHQNWLFTIDDKNSVVAVDVNLSDSGTSISKKEFVFSPTINFFKKSIQINKTGDLLCVSGSNVIAVCELFDFPNDSETAFNCPTRLISSSIPISSSVEILKVSWHPLSNRHLLVLTSDNYLRMFHVDFYRDGPEQSFNLNLMLNQLDNESKEDLFDHTFINFTFGDCSVGTWQAFTIFLLSKSTEIFALCPVVPYDAYIPSFYITDLLHSIDMEINALNSLTESKRSGKQSTNFLQISKKFLKLVCASSSPSMTGQGQQLDILTCNPSFSKRKRQISFELMLQGPLETTTTEESSQTKAIADSEVDVVDIYTVSAIPPVLVRSHNSGHLEILLFISHPLLPSFQVHQYDNPSITVKSPIPKLLFISGVDLSTQSGAKEKEVVPKQILLPTPPSVLQHFKKSQTTKDHFYVYSSCGIIRVNIPWINHVDSVLSRNSKMNELPRTSINIIWNCVTIDQPFPKIIGIASLVKPLSVHQFNDPVFVLTQFPNGTTQLIPTFIPRDSRIQLSQSIHSLLSDSLKSTSDEVDTDDETDVENQKSNKPQNLTDLSTLTVPARLGPSTFKKVNKIEEALESEHNFNFFKQFKPQYEQSEKNLQKLADDIESRLMLLKTKSAAQKEEYQNLTSKIVELAKRHEQSVKTFKKMQLAHDSLVERIEAVKKIVRIGMSIQQGSKEDQWIKEMKDIRRNLAKYQDKADSIETNMQDIQQQLRKLRIEEIPIDLNQQQIRSLEKTLDVHNQAISSLVGSLERIKKMIPEKL